MMPPRVMSRTNALDHLSVPGLEVAFTDPMRGEGPSLEDSKSTPDEASARQPGVLWLCSWCLDRVLPDTSQLLRRRGEPPLEMPEADSL